MTDAPGAKPEPCGCIRSGIDSEYCDEHALKLKPLKTAPEAKPENMVTNVTMTIYGVESDAPEPKHQAWCGYTAFKGARCNCGAEPGRRREVSEAAEPGAKPEPRCAACGREKSSNRHDVRPDWYHAFVTEPASQPGESILCPQECLKFRMLGTCEHVAPGAKPEPPNRISLEVYQHDWIPGFAAFHDDGDLAETAKAHVVLNIGSLLATVESGELPSQDLPYMIAESLMHEAIHALEAWAKVEFSEERVESLTEQYRRKYRPDGEVHWQYDPDAKREQPTFEAEPTSQPGEFNSYDVRPFSPLPKEQAKHVEHWLKSNEKSPGDVKWSLYPIGMVQRWIERALEAEAYHRAAQDHERGKR